jgi:hypothetical protein
MASSKAMRVYAELYLYVMGALSVMGVYTLESSVASLTEGRNRGLDNSLRIVSNPSLLAHRVSSSC